MSRPLAPVHYLRPNHAVWTPPAVISLDTETRVLPDRVPETLALRCWAAHYQDRRVHGSSPFRSTWGHGTDRAELAAWIDAAMVNRETVWLYCHNLSFDLVTTRLPVELVRLGWFVSDASIGGKSPWLRMGRGKKRLALVDSWSWLPRPLADLAQRPGLVKPPLPAEDADLGEWLHRCTEDVRILEASMLELMDWWDRNELGRWTISGAASGWNAFRHTRTGEKVVVDPEPVRVAADRLAVHGGRRGVWTVGEHRAGPFAELDFRAAYPTIAAELPLPAGRAWAFESLPTDHSAVSSDRWGITARVRIKTDRPRWPVRIGRHSWYPVGEFWADLAGPDIKWAAELGCLAEIGTGTVHRLGRAMTPWAQWCLSVQDGAHPDSPPTARIAAKNWGRSVIGKWAARAFDKVELGPAGTDSWGYEEGWDHTLGCRAGTVSLGGKTWLVSESADPDNAYPAVLAWVESAVRVRLSKALEAIGDGALVQCDTDGLIVALRTVGTRAGGGLFAFDPQSSPTSRLSRMLDAIAPLVEPLTLRVKSRAPHVTVIGPQHLMFGGQRRLAGIPQAAEQQPDGAFLVKQWPKLQWQMTNGSAAGYVRPERRPMVKGPYPTGWILRSGRVVPVEARIEDDGTTGLVGWESSSYRKAGMVAAELQHAALARWF